MRDILIFIMIIISILLTSLFCVGTNFVGLGINIFTNNIKTYGTGINFRLPLVTDLIYINLLKRNDVIAISNIESNMKMQYEYMLIWHVVNPRVYYEKFVPKKQQVLSDYVSLYQEQKNTFEFLKNNGIIVDNIILVNKSIIN